MLSYSGLAAVAWFIAVVSFTHIYISNLNLGYINCLPLFTPIGKCCWPNYCIFSFSLVLVVVCIVSMFRGCIALSKEMQWFLRKSDSAKQSVESPHPRTFSPTGQSSSHTRHWHPGTPGTTSWHSAQRPQWKLLFALLNIWKFLFLFLFIFIFFIYY